VAHTTRSSHWTHTWRTHIVGSEAGRPGSHTSQKARCMRHPRLVLAARARPTVGERSRNVAWNQRFHKLRSHRGLVGPRERDASPSRDVEEKGFGWRIGGGVCHVCVQRPVAEARMHRKRRGLCTTRPCGPMGRCETTRIEIRKTNLECVLESTVSLFGVLLHHAIGCAEDAENLQFGCGPGAALS